MTPQDNTDARWTDLNARGATVTPATVGRAVDREHAPSWLPLLIFLGLAATAQVVLLRQNVPAPPPPARPPTTHAIVQAAARSRRSIRAPLSASLTLTPRHGRPPATTSRSHRVPGPRAVSAAAVPLALLNVVALDFGRQRVGTPVSAQAIHVVNLGPGRLTVGSVTLTGSERDDFTVRGTCRHHALAPDDGCLIVVRFTPRARGARHARVIIADNTAGASHTITLRGRGR